MSPEAVGWIFAGSVVAGMWLRQRLYRARLRRLFVLVHTQHPMVTAMPTAPELDSPSWLTKETM